MEKLIEAIKNSNLTDEQISNIGKEAQKQFNLTDSATDSLMLMLLSNTERFKNFVFQQMNEENVKV